MKLKHAAPRAANGCATPRKMSGQAPTINPLEGHLNNFRTLQKEIGKLQSSSSEQGTRILENEMVLKELELLEEEAQVFKLIGPVLVKQELVEVKNNVSKRIEFIKNDISRLGDNIAAKEKQQDEVKKAIGALQKQAGVSGAI